MSEYTDGLFAVDVSGDVLSMLVRGSVDAADRELR